MERKSRKRILGPVGRADWVLLQKEFPDTPPERIIELLGYDYSRQQNKSGVPVVGKAQEAVERGAVYEKTEEHDEQPLTPPFWALESRQRIVPKSSPTSKDIELGDGKFPEIKPGSQPPFSPILPWPRLWPMLKDALNGHALSRQPDELKAVSMLARGEFLGKIPLKPQKIWASFSQILVDVPLRLFPFWNDFNMVVDGVAGLVGKTGLEVFFLRLGPLEDAFDRKSMEYYPVEIDQYGAPLLILSDLGAYGSAKDRDDWYEFGKRMDRLGVSPIVLTPVPKHRWDKRHKSLFRMICWDDSCCSGGGKSRVITDQLPPTAESLLTLCSSALRVEPGLLRELRHNLPGADIGVEGDAWNHPDVVHTYLSFSLKPEQAKTYQDIFCKLRSKAETENDDFSEQINAVLDGSLETINKHHTYLPSELQLEERLTQYSFTFASNTQQEDSIPDELRRYLGWLKDGAVVHDDTDPEAVQAWIRRMGLRQNSQVLNVPGAGLLKAAVAQVFKNRPKDQPLPEIITEDDLRAARGEKKLLPQQWTGVQRGEELVFRKGDKPEPRQGETPLFSISAQERIALDEGGEDEYFHLRDGLSYPLGDSSMIRIESSQEILGISSQLKPDWAESIYRNADGLFATLPLNDSVIEWILPYDFEREFQKRSKKAPKAMSFLRSGWSGYFRVGPQKGRWVNLTQLEKFDDHELPDTSWSKGNYGFDQYGLYADLEIEGIIQRMRWIHPGTFLMGSPEGEPERNKNEKQHEVTLTNGFWLADTACTQQLWEKIMGENPRKLKGDAQLPIESVTWDDCQEFLQALGKRFKGLDFRLPTEAEWEYACRAGTRTPFSFGDNITTDQANYNGYYPYNDGPKGENREKTVPVKDLSCNQWGLYQMHGNVWEWCADWSGDYPAGSVENPKGPTKGDDRVLRGGSWIFYGRSVRSASRNRILPDFSGRYVGFRFSLGQ